MPGDENVEVIVSADKMAAYICINDDQDRSLDEIKDILKRYGVSFGISDIAIRTALSGQRGKPHQVAWGIPPHTDTLEDEKTPAGSKLVFKFGRSQGKPPETLNVGPNFRHEWSKINGLGSVRAGISLAFIRNPEECSFGMTVTGEKIPYIGSKPIFKCGPNTAPSPDGRYVLATRSGIPYIEDNMPGVLDHIKIVGNIGPETGNISFPGDLVIIGDVLQGFHVSAWGSLWIKGNLGGSASCAGNISVDGGINAPRDTIECGGTVSARFCENSVIRAQGDIVISEYIMHSIVETEQDVYLNTDIGRIVGGLTRARNTVITHSVGSIMNISTLIEIGVSPKIRREYENIRKDIEKVDEEIRRIGIMEPKGPSESKSMNIDALYLQRLSALFEDKRKGLLARLTAVEETMRKSREGYFYAQTVMPGTKIVSGTDVYEFNEVQHEVRIGVKNNEAY